MRGAARFRKMETDRALCASLGWPVPETGTHRPAGTGGGARSGPHCGQPLWWTDPNVTPAFPVP